MASKPAEVEALHRSVDFDEEADTVPSDPPLSEHPELKKRAAAIRKEKKLSDVELSTFIEVSRKNSHFALFEIASATGRGDKRKVVAWDYLYLPSVERATLPEFLAWLQKRHPGQGEATAKQRILNAELVTHRAKMEENKAPTSGRRGKFKF